MAKTEPRTLSGFMELLPQDQIQFNQMKKQIEEIYQKFGFLPLDTPVIELSEVLLAKAGGETEKQIYRFNKGDKDLSLRFDLTVPLSKYVAKNYGNLSFPFRRYQIGKVYRGERTQKGRFREFYQCDIDIIGDGELELINDAELPSVIYNIFKSFGFDNFTIRVNNRKILNGLFEAIGQKESATEILRIIDKIDKIGKEAVIEELGKINVDSTSIEKIISFIEIEGTSDEKIQELVVEPRDKMIKELQEQNSLLYLTLQSQVNTVERASKYEKERKSIMCENRELKEKCENMENDYSTKLKEEIRKVENKYEDKIYKLEKENSFLRKIINTLQKTVDKFIHWVCNKFSVSSEDEFIKDFEFENDIYLDSEKQIENEEYEKDWNFEL